LYKQELAPLSLLCKSRYSKTASIKMCAKFADKILIFAVFEQRLLQRRETGASLK